MYWFITIIFLTSSCGEAPKGEADAIPNSEKSLILESKAAGNDDISVGAKLVTSLSDLGECLETERGQLRFVQDQNQFYYCSDSYEWLSINLKGPKGDPGPLGPQGIAGVNGQDGRPGTNGINGKDAIYRLYDADAHLIGVVPEISSSDFDVIHNASGYPIPVKTLATGFDIGKYSSFSICFYESNDCTGKCWIRSSSKDKPALNFGGVVGIPNLNDAELSSNLTFESVAANPNTMNFSEARADFCVSSCTNCNPSYFQMMGTTPYQPKLPFHLP